MINIIVAKSLNNVIGNNNSLIWKLPNDLKRFKKLTIHNTVVMGRKTFESIGGLLKDRRNIVITSNVDYLADGCEIVNSLDEALMLCNNNCFIIGGGEIYKQSINMTDKIYLTLIHQDFEGDTLFPEIGNEWVEVSRKDFNEPFKYSFIDYERYEF